MLAVDTNVIVRLLVKDNLEQHQLAVRLFDVESVYLAKTALLEAEWVLRFTYELKSLDVSRAIEAMISLPNVLCEDEDEVRQALAWHQQGLDFADALHLAASRQAAGLITFDRAMINNAKRLGLPVAAP